MVQLCTAVFGYAQFIAAVCSKMLLGKIRIQPGTKSPIHDTQYIMTLYDYFMHCFYQTIFQILCVTSKLIAIDGIWVFKWYRCINKLVIMKFFKIVPNELLYSRACLFMRFFTWELSFIPQNSRRIHSRGLYCNGCFHNDGLESMHPYKQTKLLVVYHLKCQG